MRQGRLLAESEGLCVARGRRRPGWSASLRPGRDAALSCRWAWVLQDALGIAFCLYMLKTIRLPTFKVSAGRVRLWGSVGGGGPTPRLAHVGLWSLQVCAPAHCPGYGHLGLL